MKLAHIHFDNPKTKDTRCWRRIKTSVLGMWILMFLFMIQGGFIHGQSISHSVIAAGGQNYTHSGSGISISWTIGEPVIGTLISENQTIILTQGFQQGSLAGDVIVVPVDFSASITVYPNPTKDYVIIKLENAESGVYSLKILDLNGKLKDQNDEIMPDRLILINTEKLASGVYLLQFFKKQELLRTVQLVKQ
ncbi:MAG TPA: T9SS type A sorting domain-containing protein [Salinivirgaceae bacterium]|nr:T9SS type A sorting domain-containing protein [Salinivirgaceae bacterium]